MLQSENYAQWRLDPDQASLIDSMVQDMLTHGIIEESSSPYASPVVQAPKGDGSKRFCVDYHRLNVIKRKDSFRLPRIDCTLDALSGCTHFNFRSPIRIVTSTYGR